MTTASLIRHVPLFDGLDTQSLDDVLRIFERVEFSAGDHLTRQGYPADCAYIVESGSADVVTALPGGGTATVAQLQPGAMLGEMALLESGMCSATVIAREAMVSYRITREGFRMLLAQRVPAVFTIQLGINTPRYASLRGIKQAAARTIDVITPGSVSRVWCSPRPRRP